MSSTPEPRERPLEHPHERPYVPTPPEELLAQAKRRSLAIRRHRLVGAGGSLAVVLALVLGSVLIPGGGTSPGHRPGQIFVAERLGSAYELAANERAPAPPPVAVVKGVERAEVAFSLALLQQLGSPNGSSNQLVSPSSLSTALAMLELGASGSTEAGIAATLRSAGLSAAEQAAGWHELAGLLAAESPPAGSGAAHLPQLDVANAVWIQQQLAVHPAFVRALSGEFGTGLWRVDFEHDLTGALGAINEWTSEMTKGLIKQLFSPGALDESTQLVLANAVFFHAAWAEKFQSTTAAEPFHLANGTTDTVSFMISTPDSSANAPTTPVATTRHYEAVELPYAGKRLSALVVMPIGSSLSSFVSSLTPSSLDRLVGGLSPANVELSMPTFTLRSDNQLNGPLSSMGMSEAFGPGADFSRITTNPQLSVQTVEQHAYLQVTPQGTTAAAATGIGLQPTAVEESQHVVINHPFLFLVRDDATGAILFEAMVENPAA